MIVADKLSRCHRIRNRNLVKNVHRNRPGFATAGTLCLHEILETLLIDGNILGAKNVFGQVQRKTVSVVQAKCNVAWQRLLVLLFEFCGGVFENHQSLLQGFTEALFLIADNLTDTLCFSSKLRIGLAHHFSDGARDLVKKRFLQSDQTAVTRRPS